VSFSKRPFQGLPRRSGKTAVRAGKMKRFPTFLIFVSALAASGWGQEADGRAYVIPIHGEINPSRMIFVRRSIEKAEEAGAQYIIFDIDTFGGTIT